MRVIDDLKFWKKKEDTVPEWNPLEQPAPKFDVAPPGMDAPMPTMPTIPTATSRETSRESQGPSQRDVELILSRLDTIKAQLESLNTRIAHLERIAEGSQPKW